MLKLHAYFANDTSFVLDTFSLCVFQRNNILIKKTFILIYMLEISPSYCTVSGIIGRFE